MNLAQALQEFPALLYLFATLLGLCIGSFLNVVAWRLPLMMEQELRDACREEYGCPPANAAETRISLSRPGSACPHCKGAIRPWHNIPVLGWALLRGRCADCGARISVQYPLVELIAGLLALVCAWRFGFSVQLAGALLLSWTLLALSVVDLRTQLLPDDLTQPLLWLGLLFSVTHTFTDPVSAIIGATAGYGVLWAVFHGFRLLTGKEGMGQGDFKLLGALGAWLGWQALPQLVLLSAAVGAAVGMGLILIGRAAWSSRLPFGPYLAGAGWIALIWGDAITASYLRVSGLAPP